MVIIGDSYSTTGFTPTESQLWWNIVSKQLNLTPHNYSVSGVGFVHGTTTFINQLQSANSDTSFNNDDVKYVFIFGGLNDVNENADAVNTAAENAFNYALEHFPKSQIVLACMPSWLNTGTSQMTKASGIISKAQYCGISFSNFNGLLIGRSNLFDAGDNHPNASGQKVIASKFLSNITGNGCVINYRNIPLTCDVGSGSPRIEIINNEMYLLGSATCNSSGDLTIDIPYNLYIYFYPSQPITIFSTVGFKYFSSSNGKLVLNGQKQANEVLYFGINLGQLPN